MANKVIKFPWLPGETGLTVDVAPRNGGTPYSTDLAVTESVVNPGTMSCTMTDAGAGVALIASVKQAGSVVAIYKVDIVEADGTYWLYDGPTVGEIFEGIGGNRIAYLTVPSDIASQLPEEDVIVARRGDTLRYVFTTGDLTNWRKITFTGKRKPLTDNDDAAIFSVMLYSSGGTNGLIRLLGAAATDHSLASLAINGLETDGQVVLEIDASVMAQMPITQVPSDLQIVYANGDVDTPFKGVTNIMIDITQSTSAT